MGEIEVCVLYMFALGNFCSMSNFYGRVYVCVCVYFDKVDGWNTVSSG